MKVVRLICQVAALTIIACTIGCCQKKAPDEVLNKNLFVVKQDMARIAQGIRYYTLDHDGHMPENLSILVDEKVLSLRGPYRGPYVEDDALFDDRIPAIPGLQPPTSFHYVPCPLGAPPRTVILYPNIRGENYLLYVLRLDGEIDLLTPEQYEKEIKALGRGYDSLPEIDQ